MRDVLNSMRIVGVREVVLFTDRLEVTLHNDRKEVWTWDEFNEWIAATERL